MFGGMTMKVSGENCGIVAKELADGGRKGVKIGEEWRREGRRRVVKEGVGGFMEYLVVSRVHYKMVGCKEVIA